MSRMLPFRIVSAAFLAAAAPLVLLAQPPARPNLVLIVLDTLRYDATSLGDSPGTSTPFLASLQSHSVVFTRAYSTHDFTPPSHFSLLTGLRDGLGGDDDHAENGVPYELERAGYSTFGLATNGLLTRKTMSVLDPITDFKEVLQVGTGGGSVGDTIRDRLEIQQRLALFGCLRTEHNISVLFYGAGRMLPVFFRQMEAAKPPFFGFANLIDPHEPYAPDPRYYPPEAHLPPGFDGDVLHRKLGGELANPRGIADPKRRLYVEDKIRDAGIPRSVSIDLTPAELAIYHQRYLGKVRELDAQLKVFFDLMERQGLLDDTIVIITSDHGESFGEDDLITHHFHDRGDYESTHHVPLMIVLPPRDHVTTHRIDRKVSIADVAPTLYDLAGLDWSPIKRTFGEGYARSLVPLFMGIPPRVARASKPKTDSRDHTQEEAERRAAMRSLGYLGGGP